MKLAYVPAAVAAGLVLQLAATAAAAADLFVIANAAATVAPGDLHDIYLGDKQFAGAQKLVPIDNGAAQEAFLAKVLKLEAGKYATLWSKKSFRDGINPPAAKGSDGETIEFVTRTAGAVGYVTAQPPAGVNVVGKF